MDYKVEDIEAGYNILLGCLDIEDDEYKKTKHSSRNSHRQTRHNLQENRRSLRVAPAAKQGPAVAPARAGGDQVK